MPEGTAPHKAEAPHKGAPYEDSTLVGHPRLLVGHPFRGAM